MSCPICQKRSPKRFCPAKGERICAVCCGTHRETTIDCPSNCPHLIAARRYDSEHRKLLNPSEIPFPDVEFSAEILKRNFEALTAVGLAILEFARANPAARDPETICALTALAEAYRTLESGIYFERPPEAPLSRALYAELTGALQEFKKRDSQQTGFSKLKDSDVFRLLIFLLRLAASESNGRPRSRAFLDFLRCQFPDAGHSSQLEPSRIILP